MTCEGVTVNIERIEEVVGISIQSMRNKEGLFAFVDPQPEKKFVDLIKTRGAEFALDAMFLITPMVIGSKTEPFFRRISVPEVLNNYSWLFKPNKVMEHNEDEVIKACFDFLRPAGRQAEPIYQWFYNCRKLSENYEGHASNFFKTRDNDALNIYKDLVVRPRAKSYEKEIRRFGPKIAKLFIQWVREYNLHELKNTEEVGIPIDFQLGRVIIQTGGLELNHPINTHTINQVILPLIFDKLGKINGWRPEEISKSLWAIGSGGCGYKRHNVCPLNNVCTKLISSFRYDRDGLFDPTDVGRYR